MDSTRHSQLVKWELGDKLSGAYYIPLFSNPSEAKSIVTSALSLDKLPQGKIYHPGPRVAGYESHDGYPDFIIALVEKLKKQAILKTDPFQVNINVFDCDKYSMMVLLTFVTSHFHLDPLQAISLTKTLLDKKLLFSLSNPIPYSIFFTENILCMLLFCWRRVLENQQPLC